jgi:rare lipoprotein A
MMHAERHTPPRAAPAPPAPDSAQPEQPRSGFYLQLGAYSRADKAAEVRARLLESGLVEMVDVVLAGSLHRLFGGPFDSREAALKAGRALPAALGIKPIVVRRGAD